MSNPLIRRIRDLLPLLTRGKFEEKVDEHLAHGLEVLSALPDEKGSVTVTITLTLAYESGRVEIKPSVKSKLPEEKAFPGTPFWTHEGAFSLQHPSQMDMFSGPRAARRADDGFGEPRGETA